MYHGVTMNSEDVKIGNEFTSSDMPCQRKLCYLKLTKILLVLPGQ